MRRVLYVSLLAVLWIAGMTAVILWLDNWLNGSGRLPMIIFAAASWTGTATVALAEEVAELSSDSGRFVSAGNIPYRPKPAPGAVCQRKLV
jgi:hypothetical protein